MEPLDLSLTRAKRGRIESGDTGRIALWMLDPDDDDRGVESLAIILLP